MTKLPQALVEAGREADRILDDIESGNVNTEANEPQADQHYGHEPEQDAHQPHSEDENSETYKQRWSVLQGKYNAEVPRLSATVRQQTEQITRLTSKIEGLMQEKEEREAANAVPPYLRHLTEEERQSVDEDSVGLQGRITEGVIEDKLKPVTEQQETINAKLNSLKSELFFSKVEIQCPGAIKLNGDPSRGIEPDPDFMEWLMGKDDGSAVTRGEIAQQAYREGDVDRVAEFFRTYLKLNGAAPKAPETVSPPSRPTPRSAEARNASKKYYTAAEANRLTQKAIKYNVQGRVKEASRIEQELTEAAMEGRIEGIS